MATVSAAMAITPFAPAHAASALLQSARQVQDSLVALRAAELLREKKVTAARENGLLQRIAAQDAEIKRLSAALRRSTAAQAGAETRLAAMKRERDAALIEAAKLRPETRVEIEAYEREVASATARPDPAIRAALRTISDSEGVRGYPELLKAYATATAASPRSAALAREVASIADTGVLYGQVDRQEAIQLWKMALALDPSYALGWLSLARHYREVGAPTEHLEAARQAVKRAQDPFVRRESLVEEATASIDLGETGNARALLQRLVSEQRQVVAAANDDMATLALVIYLHRLAMAEAAGDDPARAIEPLSEAIRILTDLAKRLSDRPGVFSELANLYRDRGNGRRRMGEMPDARADIERAVAFDRKAVSMTANGSDELINLGASLLVLGQLSDELGDKQGAERSYRECLKVNLQAQSADDPRAENNMAAAYQGLGGLQLSASRLKEALQEYGKSIEIARRHAQRSPASVSRQVTLSSTLQVAGVVAHGDGQGALARQYLEEAVAILRAQHLRDPNNMSVLGQLSVSVGSLSALMVDLRRPADAESLSREAVMLARQVYVSTRLPFYRDGLILAYSRRAKIRPVPGEIAEMCSLLAEARRAGLRASMVRLAEENARRCR